MKLWSISFSFRLGLALHALNNEGADGGNLMQPRRIDVGQQTYDGISGEIVRRHIMENYVTLCRKEGASLMPMSEALHPDRGPLGIRASAQSIGEEELNTENLYAATRKAVETCAVLDVGGFLAAFGQEAASDEDYLAERAYIDKH